MFCLLRWCSGLVVCGCVVGAGYVGIWLLFAVWFGYSGFWFILLLFDVAFSACLCACLRIMLLVLRLVVCGW